ncbi:hypothetical protein BS17DRAFT_769493 [Gyrodon lividus]|nr:hypothetical protein BS17DRAFT_769493 [Gyrodon lividus]
MHSRSVSFGDFIPPRACTTQTSLPEDSEGTPGGQEEVWKARKQAVLHMIQQPTLPPLQTDMEVESDIDCSLTLFQPLQPPPPKSTLGVMPSDGKGLESTEITTLFVPEGDAMDFKWQYISAYGVQLGNTFQSGYGMAFRSVYSSILYWDFVFTNPITLTGIQSHSPNGWVQPPVYTSCNFYLLVLLLQCWTLKNADTDIPATLHIVLVSKVPVDTPASQAPTFTWMPYISASGQYNQVQNNAMVLVYSGPTVPSSSSFVTMVTMSLADQPMAASTCIAMSCTSEDHSQTLRVTCSTLSAGVNGVVMSIALANTQIQVAGNFTETHSASGISNVLIGVFWSNSSSSHEVAIIGGNFSFPTSSSMVSQVVAIYDSATSSVTALAGAQVYRVVHALYVSMKSHLYVGGKFNLSDTNGYL